MKLPMLEKYVDEAIPPLMIFGERDGTVDIADANGDVLTGLPRHVAKKVVEANERYMNELYVILCGRPR